jgi:DNA-binding winged helix-turn-helix (wHTH) protein
MDPRLRRGFRIGAFAVEPLSGLITGPTSTQHLQPKIMDVLVYLAEHAGQLVERDTLLEQIWGRITSEEVLTRCISELRRALGDERGSPGYIQTVPKRGYRCSSPLRSPRRQTPLLGRRRASAIGPRHRSVRRHLRAPWLPLRCFRSTTIRTTRRTPSWATPSRPSCTRHSRESIAYAWYRDAHRSYSTMRKSTFRRSEEDSRLIT